MEDKEIMEEIKQDFKTHEEKLKQVKEMYQEFLDYKNATLCQVFSYKGMCENFIDLGYQKVDKDSMVISRQEYEALKLIESYHVKSCGKDTITLSKTELEALTGAFVDSTAKLVNKSTKDLADKIYQLSEEWPGGVVFWKKARKLCIEHGAED
jgi:hypothetical protein